MAETTKQPIKKNRYAWVILFVCITTAICGGGLVTNTYGVFLPFIVADMGFGAAQTSAIMTISSWTTVFVYFVATKILVKFKVRWITTIAGVLVAATLYGYSNAVEIWQFYLCAASIGILGAFLSFNVIPLLINNWFIKYKNFAVGLALMFTGIAGAVFNPILASISTQHGWRRGYEIAAIIALLYPIVAAIFARATPAEKGLLPLGIEDSEEMKNVNLDSTEIKEFPGIPAKYAVKSFPFYLVIIFVITNSFGSGFNQHWVNLGVSYGHDAVKAATLASVSLLSVAVLKVIMGMVNDKFGLLKSTVIASAGGIIACIILMINNGKSFGMIQVACIFMALAICITTIQPPMLIRDIFGMRDYSSLYPVAYMGMSLGTGTTYTLHGIFIQYSGSYMGSFIFNLCSYAVGILVVIIAYKMVPKLKANYWREVGETL